MNSHEEYHKYLTRKSFIGTIYRNFYIYPKINKFIHGRLLDYGCGVGDMLKFYSNSIGTDINPLNIKYCLNRNLRALSLEDLRKSKLKFETIILDNVLEHVVDYHELLENIKLFAKKGTTLIIGVPGIKGFYADDDHKIYYDENNIINLMKPFKFKYIYSFSTPWKSSFLNKYFKRYCNFYIFQSL